MSPLHTTECTPLRRRSVPRTPWESVPKILPDLLRDDVLAQEHGVAMLTGISVLSTGDAHGVDSTEAS